MSLRAQSQLSNTTPAQGQIPSWLQQRASSLGGGKGQAGSMPQQANPQGMMVQQLLQAMQARRAAQAQQFQQVPAFMSPAQRLAQMPQQSLQALTQAAPQPFFGASPVAQAPTQLPGIQAQQALQPTTGLPQLPGIQAQQAAQQLGVNPLASPAAQPATAPQFESRASVFSGANPFPQGSTLGNDWEKWQMYQNQSIDPYAIDRANFPTLRSLLDSLPR